MLLDFCSATKHDDKTNARSFSLGGFNRQLADLTTRTHRLTALAYSNNDSENTHNCNALWHG
jgi:hypothetical protein